MNDVAGIVYATQKDFSDAIRPFALLKVKQHPGQAIVSWADGDLYISLPGMEVGFPVSGTWPASVRVPAYFIIWHAQKVPRGDQIEIGVQNGRFSINGARVKCEAQVPDSIPIELPMEPSLKQLSGVHLNYDAASIDSAGLTRIVDDAWQKTLKRVKKAAKNLEPLGVTESNLLEFVKKQIDETNKW